MNDSGARTLEFTVDETEAGSRLDAYLADRCPDFSRTRIQNDLSEGRVSVQGRQRPKGFKLKAGWRVSYEPGPVQAMQAVAQDLPLDIVHRDEDLIVLNKAADMVVHPAPGHPDGTVVNALLHHFGRWSTQGDPLRPGIVHRLDRDTSGLMAVALTESAHNHLAAQLKDRRMGRHYLALSWGQWPEMEGTLRGDIGRHPQQRVRMAVLPRGGRPAVTHYAVLEDFGFAQLCEVKLETGRTHQIRVHFAHHHHPVVGDPLYGDDRRAGGVHPLDLVAARAMVKGAARQMLHARRLELIHPRSGEPMTFEADPPDDFQAVLRALRERGGA